MLFFTVFLRILTYAGVLPALAGGLSALLSPLGLSPLWAQRLLTGLVELSSGVTSLTDGPLSGRLSMAAFMLGWAGMCVHCQVLAFLGDSGLSLRTYVGGKALHALLSSLLAAGLYRLFPPVSYTHLDVYKRQPEGRRLHRHHRRRRRPHLHPGVPDPGF